MRRAHRRPAQDLLRRRRKIHPGDTGALLRACHLQLTARHDLAPGQAPAGRAPRRRHLHASAQATGAQYRCSYAAFVRLLPGLAQDASGALGEALHFIRHVRSSSSRSWAQADAAFSTAGFRVLPFQFSYPRVCLSLSPPADRAVHLTRGIVSRVANFSHEYLVNTSGLDVARVSRLGYPISARRPRKAGQCAAQQTRVLTR